MPARRFGSSGPSAAPPEVPESSPGRTPSVSSCVEVDDLGGNALGAPSQGSPGMQQLGKRSAMPSRDRDNCRPGRPAPAYLRPAV